MKDKYGENAEEESESNSSESEDEEAKVEAGTVLDTILMFEIYVTMFET